MTQPAPEPLPAEPETRSLALCADRATAEAVRALVDAEHGYPKVCKRHDGQPAPPGVPCTILHALELEPVGRTAAGVVTSWAHPLPRAPLRPELAARVETKTRTEIDALRPDPPTPAEERIP